MTLTLLFVAPAGATELATKRVVADSAVARTCHERLLTTGGGYAQHRLTAPDTSYLTARLTGGSGDWDLAVFTASGDHVASSAHLGPDEIASGYAFEGEELVVQACRRSGDGAAADLTVDAEAIDTSAKPETSSLVEVSTPTRERKAELAELDLDLTEHGGKDYVEVVLHGADDARKLTAANFVYKVEVPDLAAQAERDRAADARFEATTSASALPSGNTAYRHLADYTAEMKELAEQNPGLVKPITLNHRTYEGRPVEGIEITTNVNARDGKPVFLQMGVHHAREWPSGEHALEWAYELVNGYKAGDPRTKRLVESTRTIVVPIVNPDGFNASREAGEIQGGGDGRGTPNSGEGNETVNIVAHPQEYRRKNCRLPNDAPSGTCLTPGLGVAENGVDPNRNYGGFWGGPGAGTTPENLTYRGPGPFSEPETRNVRELVSTRQVTTLITNHTFANLILRPPGLQSQGLSPDEPLYKAFGDSMAEENGYTSQYSWQLYDTSGTTEDWSYYATGGLGFTYEIGCVDKDDGETGETTTQECLTGHFHPPFERMVDEWEGETPFSDAGGRDGGGNRAAYYKAQESTADPAMHSVIKGDAPPGAILRLKKEFDTPTSQKNSDGSPVTFRDKLETTMQVPSDGRFEWHINQSTRPLVIREFGRRANGDPSPPQSFSGNPAGPPADRAAPCADYDTNDPGCWNDHQFTVPSGPGIDNAKATIHIEWPTPASDWDMKVFEDTDGDGSSAGETNEVGSSGQGTTDFEQTTVVEPNLVPGKKYVVRVINWAAAEPYTGKVAFDGPDFRAAAVESWTLTCERPEGTAATTQPVTIARGEQQTLDLSGCAERSAAAAGSGGGTQPSGEAEGRTGRNFVISRRAVKIRNGIAAVRVSCRSPRGCAGTLYLRKREIVRTRSGKRRGRYVTIGKRRFSYPAKRRNAIVRVRLTRRGLRMASTKRRTRIAARAGVRFGDGTRAKPSARFWLYRPSSAR